MEYLSTLFGYLWWLVLKILGLLFFAAWTLVGTWVVLGGFILGAIWVKRVYDLGWIAGTHTFIRMIKRVAQTTLSLVRRLWIGATAVDAFTKEPRTQTITIYKYRVPWGYVSLSGLLNFVVLLELAILAIL